MSSACEWQYKLMVSDYLTKILMKHNYIEFVCVLGWGRYFDWNLEENIFSLTDGHWYISCTINTSTHAMDVRLVLNMFSDLIDLGAKLLWLKMKSITYLPDLNLNGWSLRNKLKDLNRLNICHNEYKIEWQSLKCVFKVCT